MTFKINFTKESQQDYDKLDHSQQIHIRKSMQRIEESGLLTGQPLRGKLADCRKLKHKKLGLRVVFKQADFGIEIIEIIVVGKRDDQEVYRIEVYRIAEKRLGR